MTTTKTARHRQAWTTDRRVEDLRNLTAVATGQRVDLTKGYRK